MTTEELDQKDTKPLKYTPYSITSLIRCASKDADIRKAITSLNRIIARKVAIANAMYFSGIHSFLFLMITNYSAYLYAFAKV